MVQIAPPRATLYLPINKPHTPPPKMGLLSPEKEAPISISTKKPRPQELCSCGRGRYVIGRREATRSTATKFSRHCHPNIFTYDLQKGAVSITQQSAITPNYLPSISKYSLITFRHFSIRSFENGLLALLSK